MSWQRTNNTTGTEHCRYCLDGWVELKGTTKAHGYHYSRGSAPCKFCELGLKRWARMKEKRVAVDDSYTAADVDLPTPDEKPVSRHEAKRLLATLIHQAKPAIVEKTETAADVKRRIEAAQAALEESEPEPFAPTGTDDIPF